jgi:hypothetical protein
LESAGSAHRGIADAEWNPGGTLPDRSGTIVFKSPGSVSVPLINASGRRPYDRRRAVYSDFAGAEIVL